MIKVKRITEFHLKQTCDWVLCTWNLETI